MGPKSFRKLSLEQYEQLNQIVHTRAQDFTRSKAHVLRLETTGQPELAELGEELEVGAD